MNLSDYISKYSIKKVSANSRDLEKNTAFVALKGANHDGNEFIEEAISAGVELIFTESIDYAQKFKGRVEIVLVKNARKTIAEICCILYENIPKNLVAITGTNGKSSVVHYIGGLSNFMGIKSASIGTLGVRLYSEALEEYKELGLTTADVVTFNKELAALYNKGIELCALEASSIGLDQYRLYGRKFKIAGFTSFSRDHLDYHGDMSSYLDAKLKLFAQHQDNDGISIINSDIPEIDKIKLYLKNIGRKYITYGSLGDYQIKLNRSDIEGQKFTLKTPIGEFDSAIKIIGDFQLGNVVMAIIALVALGYEISDILKHLPKLSAPKGRLERVMASGKGSRIFIDYAHSPDALENVLKMLKKAADASESKLWVLFGCGGDRDKLKRPIMGKIAADLADKVIVTDDNPRSEDPGIIRSEIIADLENIIEVADRRSAIEYAIRNMDERDILLIAGKGHEEYQIIGAKKNYFSDKKTCLELLNMPN